MFTLISSRDVITRGLSYFNSTLISQNSIRQLIKGIEGIPKATSSIVLECRLQPRKGQVDLALCFVMYEGSEMLLINWLNALNKRKFSYASKIADIIRDWNSIIQRNHAVQAIWLEYDGSDSGIVSSKLPSIFLSYKRKYYHSDIVESANALISTFNKYNLLHFDVSEFKNALSAFSNLVIVRHIGVLLARDPIILRLCVEMETENVITYLRHIKWSGNIDIVKSLISITDYKGRITLNLDYSDILGKRIGLEYGLRHDQGSTDHDRFYQSLEHNGLCTEDQYNALIEWIGTSTEFLPPLSVPLRLKREISHIKIDVNDNKLSSKAYLWIGASGMVSSM